MKNGTETVTPHAGALVKQEFGSRSLEVRAETASAAVAAQAQAAVQARYVMAMQRPRDWDSVRQRILAECQRPGFAEVALYSKPVSGKPMEGLSIRFAEAALRCMTNVFPEVTVVYEDRTKRIVRVALTDLEGNLTFSKDIVVEKTVERRTLKDGQDAIAERTNSYGKKVYIVEATEDDLLNKQAALESKALRSHALRLLPGDIADEAEALIRATLANRAAKDPGAERKRIIDAFGAIGVPVAELVKYVGHPLEAIVPAELVELRAVYAAVKDGEATWQDQLALRLAKMKPPAEAPAAAGPQPFAPAASEPPASAPAGETVVEPVADDPVTAAMAAMREAAKKGKRALNDAAHKAQSSVPPAAKPRVLALYRELAKEAANVR